MAMSQCRHVHVHAIAFLVTAYVRFKIRKYLLTYKLVPCKVANVINAISHYVICIGRVADADTAELR